MKSLFLSQFCFLILGFSFISVKAQILDTDKQIFKTHSKSLVDWESVDAQRWLDLDSWIEQREMKNKNTNWKVEKRIKEHKEILGTIIQCLGECKVHGRLGVTKGRFKTRIYEGDEVETFENSSAWIALVDGSLMRLAAFSSLSFYEIDFTKESSLITYRLNRGHTFSSSRQDHPAYDLDKMQTDTGFFPLHHLEANQEFYMREEFKKFSEDEKLKYALELNPGSSSLQIALTESLKKYPQNKASKHFIITANSSYIVQDGQYHLFHETKGETLSFFDRAVAIEVGFRGYNNTKLQKLETQNYYKVDPEGQRIMTDSSIQKQFSKIQYLVSRIPSLYMARELELNSLMPILMNEKVEIGLKFDYYEWRKEDLDEHLLSLIDYSRRIETTNLSVIKKFFKDKSKEGMTDKFFQHAYALHLYNLGNRDYDQLEKIKSYDKARYYLWVMKNGKKFISSSFR